MTGSSIPRRAPLLARLQGEYRLDWLRGSFSVGEQEKLDELGREAFAARFAKLARYYGIDHADTLVVDDNLVAWGVGNASPELLARALKALGQGDGERARRVLERYVPCGPGAEADEETWRKWADENAPYLFFLEMGGYRWYVDPLAKARGVPSKALRGPARADAAKTVEASAPGGSPGKRAPR